MPDQPTKTSFCFVLMPTDPGLVNLWDAVIRPAIEQAGLRPLRGDDLATGSITQFRRHILQAAVVIVVISAKDPSRDFLYKLGLGLAHAAKKKVILLQEKGVQLPLALSSLHCVEYDSRNFPQSRETLFKILERFKGLRLSRPPALLSPPVQEESKPQDLSFSLKSFKIKNFQCIKDTGMDGLPADAPWIFITGDNGDGKTSLLQALAIGLNGSEDAEQRLKSIPDAKIGVEIREAGEAVVRDFFRWDGHWILADHLGGAIAPVANLVTYGPARLDLSGESSRANEVAERSPVYSLLQQRGNLRNIEHWLKMRALEQDDLSQQRIKQVKKVLVTLMPNVTEMALVGSVFKYTEKGHVVESHNLSAGQYNILAMVGDLLIRLYESQPDVVELKELRGIVLIDELDIHLHPIRQKELPGQLSTIFPNVQFIATTHSVIPVMGAPKGSVFLRVVRDALLGTRVDRPDIEIGNLLPNAVLTSPLFEVNHPGLKAGAFSHSPLRGE